MLAVTTLEWGVAWMKEDALRQIALNELDCRIVGRKRVTAPQVRERVMADIAKGTHSNRKRYTFRETQEQIRIVQDAWIEGASDYEIHQIFRKLYAEGKVSSAISMYRVEKLRERVQAKVVEDGEKERPFNKIRQVRRITKALRETKGAYKEDGTVIRKPDHASRVKYEDLIAKIEGNFEPIKVEVDAVHRHAIIEVIASLTPEDLKRYADAYDQVVQLAETQAKAQNIKLPDLLPRAPPPQPIVLTTPTKMNGTH